MFSLVFVTSKRARMQIQVSILSCCKSCKQATVVAGKQNRFFPTTQCVWSMPEDKVSLPENTCHSSCSVAFCTRCNLMIPRFYRNIFSSSSVFTKQSEMPFEPCSFSDSLSHEQSWEALCRLHLPSFLLSALPLHRPLHFSWQSRIRFQGTFGSLCFQSPWSSLCTKENAVLLEKVMFARVDDRERVRSGWMVLMVLWGWGSVMMQAAKSTREDI